MILEGLITTRTADGGPHLAAMGPEVDADDVRAGTIGTLILKPFTTSQTAANLAVTPAGVFHVTDDVLLLARTVAGVGPVPPLDRAVEIDGWRIPDASLACEFLVESADRSAERQRLVARVVRVHRGRPFLGHVRARHAVVEAAILVTRLHILPAGEIAARLADLAILVDKTGGPIEREAFEILRARAAGHGGSQRPGG